MAVDMVYVTPEDGWERHLCNDLTINTYVGGTYNRSDITQYNAEKITIKIRCASFRILGLLSSSVVSITVNGEPMGNLLSGTLVHKRSLYEYIGNTDTDFIIVLDKISSSNAWYWQYHAIDVLKIKSSIKRTNNRMSLNRINTDYKITYTTDLNLFNINASNLIQKVYKNDNTNEENLVLTKGVDTGGH